MKKLLIASALGSLASLCSGQTTKPVAPSPPPDRVAIFQVPLRCPAAPQIGCGSSAKPILLELERDADVTEASLNRTGTLIAVVWKSAAKPAPMRAKIEAKASAAGCCAKDEKVTELKGEARNAALKEFNAGSWYRGAEVDRLSEEEAGIIAARLVRRVQAKAPLVADKARSLEQALSQALSKRLINGDDGNYEPEFRRISAEFLDVQQTAVLKEAIESGLRPSLNEK